MNNEFTTMMGVNYDMMITRAVMAQFDKYETRLDNSTQSIFGIFTNHEFSINFELLIMKIMISALCIYAMDILKKYFKNFGNFISNIINNYILCSIIYIFSQLKYKILRKKFKYTITRNISLITSKLKNNQELFNAIDWYVNSDICKRPEKKIKDIIRKKSKKRPFEIYVKTKIKGNGFRLPNRRIRTQRARRTGKTSKN